MRKRIGDVTKQPGGAGPQTWAYPITSAIPDGYTRKEPAFSTIIIVAGALWWLTRGRR